jgi:hypothetical protein
MFLPGLMAGILIGMLMTAPLTRQASAPLHSEAAQTPFDVTRLSPAELETLALDVLTTLNGKSGPEAAYEPGAVKTVWNPSEDDRQQIHLGLKNVRRLLPLARNLTQDALAGLVKTTNLSREKRLIAAVHRIVLDSSLSNAAVVREDDLSVIRISPDYAAYLVSDDEAMLLLSHELTHVAARTGRLNDFIEDVNKIAHSAARLELNEEQKEELACDFTGALVLRRYIALYPTGETGVQRFSRVFGYEPPRVRLALAWQDFCASYNGAPPDDEHLSQDQILRALVGLDPELRALIPGDAISTSICR